METSIPPLSLPAPPALSLEPPAPAPPAVRALEVAALLALVAIGDRALWPGAGGFGVALLFVLAAVVLVAASPVRRRSVRLAGIGLALGAVAARSAWSTSLWTALVGVGLVFSLAIALRTKRSYVPELWLSGLVSSILAFPALGRYGRVALRLAMPGRLREVRWARVLVPVAVVSLFALFFVAANPLLERWTSALGELLWSSSSFPSIERVLLWGLLALVGAALLAPAIREPRLSSRLGPGHRLDAASLAAPGEGALAIARNVLFGVNALYLGYNALDAVYLWAGTPPPGISFTQYAHRGTVWLTVSLAAATVVLGVLFRGAMAARGRETEWTRRLAYVWAAQNLVLAAGTFRRITMYVDDSGLTQLRALGIVGVVLVAVAFLLIVLKLARGHTALWLMRRQLDALAIALVCWTVLPVDSMVWSFNVARIRAGEDRPLLHLFLQPISAEAVPALVPLLDHPDPVVSSGVAAQLVALQSDLAVERDQARSWSARDLAVPRALAALERARARVRARVGIAAASRERLRVHAAQVNGMDPNAYFGWSF